MCRFLQFRLRTLLVLVAAAAVATRAAEWWFGPFVIEECWEDRTLKSQYRARRNWRGNIIAWGAQTEYHPNGKMSRRWLKWCGAPGGECGQDCQHWSQLGSPLTHADAEPDYESLLELIVMIRPQPWLVDEPTIELVDPIATDP